MVGFYLVCSRKSTNFICFRLIWGICFFRNVLHRFEDHLGATRTFGAERVLDLFLERLVAARAADSQHDLVGAEASGEYLDDVVVHAGDVLQHVVQRGRVERRALEFDHLPPASDHRREAHRRAAAGAASRAGDADVARLEAQQRHAPHAERGNDHLALLSLGHGVVLLCRAAPPGSMSAGTCPPQWCPHSVIEVCISVEAYVEKSSSSGHSSVIFAPSVLLLKSVSRSASPMQIARRSDERR